MLMPTHSPEPSPVTLGCISSLSLTWGGQVAGDLIRRDAGSVSPSPRFAESAQQNGERAGVRCFVIHTLPVTTRPHALFETKDRVEMHPSPWSVRFRG